MQTWSGAMSEPGLPELERLAGIHEPLGPLSDRPLQIRIEALRAAVQITAAATHWPSSPSDATLTRADKFVRWLEAGEK